MQQNMMGQNIIITEPSKSLRALGRNALAGKWKIAVLAVIVYQLCIEIPSVILNSLFGTKVDLYGVQMDYNYNVDVYSDIYNSMPTYSTLSGIYLILVSGAFALGISLFFLALFRKQQVGVTDVFLGFEHFGKALGLMLFQTLFTVLWALLFIVPGIIAAIRYSQAFFILADDPDKGIRQCMNESKMMMKGNKAKFFCLTLSFIGWALLSAIPAGIVESIVSIIYMPAFVQSLIIVIASLLLVPVTVYMYSAFAGFYEILAGHLIKETDPAPVVKDDVPVLVDSEESGETPASSEESGETPASSSVDVAQVMGQMGQSNTEQSNEETVEKKDDDDNDIFPKEV